MQKDLFKYFVFFGVLVAFCGALPAHAHKVNVFAYVEDGKIHVESYFPDGKPVEGGALEVLDAQSRKVADGVTDKEGKCVIPVPKEEDLTIVINASMGHKNSYLLKKSEITQTRDQADQAAPAQISRKENAVGTVDCRELAAMIQQQESLISSETGQLKREIAALRDDLSRPGVKEIFAGIGYILGLAGVGLYVQSRRSTRNGG